jgi:hypothetical protein
MVAMFLEKQDEVVYYDPCESPEELKVIEEAVKLQDGGSTEVRELSQQRRHLEAKRGRICTRRAQLRSRQVGCALRMRPLPHCD